MISSLKIKDTAGWTMFIFGTLAFLLGLMGLLRPEILLSILGFNMLDPTARTAGDYTIVFMVAASMASFNMGVYYILAAVNDIKSFYEWTVPFRFVTFVVFTSVVLTGIAPARFLGVVFLELTGAVATGLALRSDRRKSGEVHAFAMD